MGGDTHRKQIKIQKVVTAEQEIERGSRDRKHMACYFSMGGWGVRAASLER